MAKLKFLLLKCMWSGLKCHYLWMRQKAVAAVLNWRVIKKNKLFSCVLVAQFGNLYWHGNLLVNQYLHITTWFLFEIHINPQMSLKICLRAKP